jgi:hypothetical protein
MPERRRSPDPSPDRAPERSEEDDGAPFLDGPEPDWVERLQQNRKAQVKRWERVLGTGGRDDAVAGTEDGSTAPPGGSDPPGEPGARPRDGSRAPARKLRRTDAAEPAERPESPERQQSKDTPAFYDQDEEE